MKALILLTIGTGFHAGIIGPFFDAAGLFFRQALPASSPLGISRPVNIATLGFQMPAFKLLTPDSEFRAWNLNFHPANDFTERGSSVRFLSHSSVSLTICRWRDTYCRTGGQIGHAGSIGHGLRITIPTRRSPAVVWREIDRLVEAECRDVDRFTRLAEELGLGEVKDF